MSRHLSTRTSDLYYLNITLHRTISFCNPRASGEWVLSAGILKLLISSYELIDISKLLGDSKSTWQPRSY